MKNKDFFIFLAGVDKPKSSLLKSTQIDVQLSFHKNRIILTFIGLQFLGAILSLMVCPQFGLGFIKGHGITHFFRLIGDWACAAFCGSFFFVCGLAVTFIWMKPQELWWIWKRYRVWPLILPGLFWAILMLINFSLNIESETISYHVVWLIMAIVIEVTWMQVKSKVYVNRLEESKAS